jgi:membrane fusion protein (multidrug efflux system)
VVDGTLVERPVRLGERAEGATAANGAAGVVEIVEGLAAGDRIVGTNLGTLRTGSRVRIATGTGT